MLHQQKIMSTITNISCKDASDCPACQKKYESPYRLFYHFYEKHMVKCGTCQLTGFHDAEEAERHNESVHTEPERHSSCPLCGKVCRSEEEFTGHVFLNHRIHKEQGNDKTVKCPPCNIELVCDSEKIVTHLKQHMNSQITGIRQQQIQMENFLRTDATLDLYTQPCGSPPKYSEIYGATYTPSQPSAAYAEAAFDLSEARSISNTAVARFKVGDRVNAMWGLTKSQYFPATVVEVRSDVKKCIIRWDDGDTTGVVVNFNDMAIDRIPNENELQAGSQVFFVQGGYRAGGTQLSGGQRWHRGRITTKRQSDDGHGTWLYDGCHLEQPTNGKPTYNGYSFRFTGYNVSQLREGVPVEDDKTVVIQPTKKTGYTTGDMVIVKPKGFTGKYFSAKIKNVYESERKYKVKYADGKEEKIPYDHVVAMDICPPCSRLSVGSIVLFQSLSGTHPWCVVRITSIYGESVENILCDGEILDKRVELSPFRQKQPNHFRIVDTELVVSSIARPSMHQVSNNTQNNRLPVCGNRVLALWSTSKWQYFHATIKQVMPNFQYLIAWDDGDVTGLIVTCIDVAIDQLPNQDDIGVESIVLFQQGGYKAGENQQSGGMRWHQGKITKIYQSNDGSWRYNGCHTKTEADGKWITYKGYSPTFTGLRLEELRRGPNLFDIIDKCSDIGTEPVNRSSNLGRSTRSISDDHREEKMQEAVDRGTRDYLLNIKEKILETPPSSNEASSAHIIDVFFSYCWQNSFCAEQQKHVTYSLGSKYSDPRSIQHSIAKSFNTWLDIECLHMRANTIFQQHSDAIKSSNIFVACISDEYASNVFCRMQFQYAFQILRKPVIAIVVGSAGNLWKETVIGIMLRQSSAITHDLRVVSNDRELQKMLDDITKDLHTVKCD